VIIHTIESRTHGRFLVEHPAEARELPLLVGFHGYAETAEAMMQNLKAIAGPLEEDAWCVVSVQALHRFYTRTQEVVANWMTRQDRELEIADNTAFVWSVVHDVQRSYRTRRPIVFAGFSQGVAMAYRAAAAAPCDGLIVLAGDVPPDVAPRAGDLPPVLLGRGVSDEWYTAEKAAADLRVLQSAGVAVEESVFDGGHVWDERFSQAARGFLQQLAKSVV
jgi:predicted esterase